MYVHGLPSILDACWLVEQAKHGHVQKVEITIAGGMSPFLHTCMLKLTRMLPVVEHTASNLASLS